MFLFFYEVIFPVNKQGSIESPQLGPTTSIIPVRYGAVNKWRHESIMDINKFYHSFGQHCAYPAVDPETWFSVNFQKIVVKIRPGPRWGLTAPPDPQLEKVGLDHPVEKSFPRHWSWHQI